MTEMEKMLAGKLYDPSDAELSAMRVRAHELSRQISGAPEGERKALLRELIPQMGADVDIIGPVFFDYGSFTVIGERTFINADLKVLDCCPVTIGKNVMIGTGCTIWNTQSRSRLRTSAGWAGRSPSAAASPSAGAASSAPAAW